MTLSANKDRLELFEQWSAHYDDTVYGDGEADLLKPLPDTLHVPFDDIVSAYVFHEFDPSTRMKLLQSLAKTCLVPGGVFVIGDIVFSTGAKREEARIHWRDEWDEDEFYWAADEALAGFNELGWTAVYKQISVCAGVFVVKPPS